jgi:hypothetical protein
MALNKSRIGSVTAVSSSRRSAAQTSAYCNPASRRRYSDNGALDLGQRFLCTELLDRQPALMMAGSIV